MRQKIGDLIKMGMLIRDPDPYYASPAFMIPKKNGKWRMVVDLRHVNKYGRDECRRPTQSRRSARVAARATSIFFAT